MISNKNLDLKYSVWDGAFYSLMVGVGESYIPAFVLALTASEIQSGMITVIPFLVGALVQLAAPSLSKRWGEDRSWIVLCCVVQGLSLLPLAFAAHSGSMNYIGLFVFVSLYWASGMSASPSWNRWIAHKIPDTSRTSFFSHRNRVMNVFTFSGLCAGGFWLHYSVKPEEKLGAFTLLFCLAVLFRWCSAFLIGLQKVGANLTQNHKNVPLESFFMRSRRNLEHRFVVFLFLIQGAVQVSAPFSAAFLIKGLSLDYLQYMELTGIQVLAKFLALPAIGVFAKRHSTEKLFLFSALGVGLVPFFYLMGSHFYFLFAVHFMTGVVWASFELSILLLFIEWVAPDYRASLISKYNFFYAIFTLAGGALGAMCLSKLGNAKSTYLIIFAISGLLRILAFGYLLHIKKMYFASKAQLRDPIQTRNNESVVSPNSNDELSRSA